MKLKTLALAVAILAVLSLAAYYLQRPPATAGTDPRVHQPVFDAKLLEKTAKIRLADQGKTVVLARQPDGKWVVPSYYDLPADFSKLSRFIDDLSGAKIQRLVTQNPERLARLDFKDTSVALLDPANQALWTLTLGKDAEGGGRFVRFDDEKKGYQANLSLFVDATAKNWADTLLFDLKPDDIAGVEITFGDDAPVTATRAKKAEAWVADQAPPGQRIKSDRLTALLGSFTSIRFQDTSDLTDADVAAARQHRRTVKLTTFDHKAITVELDRKPEEKKVIGGPKTMVKGENATDAGQKAEPGNQGSAATHSEPVAAPPAAEPGEPGTKNQVVAASPGSAESKTLNTAPATPLAPTPAKPEEPKTETIPAGPVYVFIASSDPGAAVNALMKKRAFQIYDWNFTSLPQKRDELFEPIPAPPPPPENKPDAKPEAAGKTDPKR